MAKLTIGVAAAAIIGAISIVLSQAQAEDSAQSSAAKAAPGQMNGDWPQYCGPNRNGLAGSSPKLSDSWPKEGPPLLWKSENIPSYMSGGGCASPVVADGKVFVYVNWKKPVGGGQKIHLINSERLIDIGWLPDIADDLAKKIEAARVSAIRPATHGPIPAWYFFESPKEEEIDAFLAKNADLDKYIKDFIATLDPKDAKKYGAYIKRRICMQRHGAAWERPYTWDELVKLSKLCDLEFETEQEWRRKLTEININVGYGNRPFDFLHAWIKASTVYDTVVCLDASTGNALWKQDFLVDKAIYKNTDVFTFGVFGVSATPVIWNGKCYAQGLAGMYCLSTKDGSLLWQTKSVPTHSSPLVANGIVYNYGSAYDAENGRLLWTKNWRSASSISPSLWRAEGKNYVICTDDAHMWCCLDMETGKALWSKLDQRGCGYGSYISVISGDIMVGEMHDEFCAYRLSPSEAKLLWKKKHGGEAMSSCVVWNDSVFVFTGAWECFDLKTGDSKWIGKPYPYAECDNVISRPLFADGKIFNTLGRAHNDRNDHEDIFKIEMLSANLDKYVRLGEFNPRVACMSSPALANGKLYLRLEKCVACYDLTQH